MESRAPSRPIARRLVAEFVGSAMLVAVVVGSGIAAQRLSPDDVGLQLLENSTATALGIGALILIFGPVSGAHFNPVVSLADSILGRRSGTGIGASLLWRYVLVQVAGAIAGAVLANVMFDRPAIDVATTGRTSTGHILAELVATPGLVAVIFTLARTGRTGLSAAAVGAYLGAAYWFTSSTSFANPAVTVGRVFSDTFAGIAPTSVLPFVAAQLVGAVLFLCTHNAGRSQMAMGFVKHLAGARAGVYSGGSEPAREVNSAAVAAMAEKGIDIATEQPKRWTMDMLEAADVVISMGCGESCPVLPGRRYEEWTLPDPAGQSVEAVRPIRDDIERRVRKLLEQLGVDVQVVAHDD